MSVSKQTVSTTPINAINTSNSTIPVTMKMMNKNLAKRAKLTSEPNSTNLNNNNNTNKKPFPNLNNNKNRNISNFNTSKSTTVANNRVVRTSDDEFDDDLSSLNSITNYNNTVAAPAPAPPPTFTNMINKNTSNTNNKRTTSLPPSNINNTSNPNTNTNTNNPGSKNVVYLNLKNRYIKSDGAYSVSQVIKVPLTNYYIIFLLLV